MKILRFTEYPVFVDEDIYINAVKNMSHKLMQTGHVKCVYQVGSVSSPGISDLDLFVIFKDGTKLEFNPVSELEFPENYLFSHKLFGVHESLAAQMEKFTHFGNYRLIEGEPVDMFNFRLSEDELQQLKSQIALEYLIKAWVAISMGIEYGVIKLRSFLLHAKAVQYDIEFLQIKNENLCRSVATVLDIRKNWFNNNYEPAYLSGLVMNYRDAVSIALGDLFKQHRFYIPANANLKIAKNITIIKHNEAVFKRSGVCLPSWLPVDKKLLLKFNSRMNSFDAGIPYQSDGLPEIIQLRFDVMKNAFAQNHKHLPAFICTGHGLNIFNI